MNPNTTSRILRALRDRPGDTAARWLRRAGLQIQFARAFAAALPADVTAGWSERIDRAQAIFDAFNPNKGLYGLTAAVEEAETEMAPIGKAAKTYRIHCVGHGHIDMNWMWSWPETVSTTHDTFASVLSLMEQYPELTYSQSQASVYALVEKYFPEMFERIRERVREGRWEITAAHWVEGDKNLSSGESICRHLLYTRAYFREKFGLDAEDLPIDWEPDTFGHANSIPTILAQGGVRYYYSCRTGGGFDHYRVGEQRPRLFWWEGPDGARVLVNREATWYNSYVNIGDNIALPLVEFVHETRLHEWLNVYGIGNHGGGPTRTEIDYYREMREWPIYPEVVFSTAKRYFDAVSEELAARPEIDLPIVDHEMNFEFTGCYTSQSLIKQANRFGENYLVEAETLATLSSRLFGKEYPVERLRQGWLNILFNQFHDILPGSGVRATREHATALFQETGAITGSIKRIAGMALTAGIDTLSLLPATPEADEERALLQSGAANTPFVAGAGIEAGLSGYSIARGGGSRFRPVVVYNPCAWARTEPVTVAIYDSDLDANRIVALDEEGRSHPTFLIGKGKDWDHEKITVSFNAHDIPALGYRTYLLCEGSPDVEEPQVEIEPNQWFETPFLKMRIDRYGSGICELIDKRTGARLTQPYPTTALGGWEYVVERPRGMTAWVLGGEPEMPVPLRVTGFRVHGAAGNQGTSVPHGSNIAYRIITDLEVPGTQSTVRLTTDIRALEPRIDVTAEIDWREIGDAKRGIPGLCVRFPLDLYEGNTHVRYETPFGSVPRELFDGEEVPTLRYAHVAAPSLLENDVDAPCGFTLLQDCKYGHSMDGSHLRLRMIRSSFDPDHAPEVVRETVRYSMYFHEDESDPASLTRLGAAWNHPLIVFPANLQSGDAPASRSFANVISDGVVLTALKRAEGDDSLVLRLAELNGEDTEAVVEIDPALTAGLTTATLLDLMERPVAGEVSWENGTLRAAVKANGFVTVRLSGEA